MTYAHGVTENDGFDANTEHFIWYFPFHQPSSLHFYAGEGGGWTST